MEWPEKEIFLDSQRLSKIDKDCQRLSLIVTCCNWFLLSHRLSTVVRDLKGCQVWPEMAIYSQRLSEVAKDCQSLSGIIRDCQILSEIAKDCQ